MVKAHWSWPNPQHVAWPSPYLNSPCTLAEPSSLVHSTYMNSSTCIFPGFTAPAIPNLKSELTNEVQGFLQHPNEPCLNETHSGEAVQDASLQKKLLVFDHSGSKTRLLYIDPISNNHVLPVFCYCAASILMTVVNKFVVSGHHFSMNFLLLTIQSVVCVGCVALSKSLRLIKYRDLDKNDVKRWFPISFLLVVVIYTGSKALQFLTIPVYTIFKNLTIILIAYGEVIWFNGTLTGLTLVSFGLMVLSSLVAAWSDISPFLSLGPGLDQTIPDHLAYGQIVKKNAGYFWMLVNCLASAAYVLAMRKKIKLTNFKDWDTMFYNNLLSIPILIVFSLTFEDWSSTSLDLNFPLAGRNLLLGAMCFSGAAAVFISYTTAWCVRMTSSTTYSMVGALNKLPVAASGMIFFGDPVTFGNVAAVSIGFIAGLVYAIAKTNQQKKTNPDGISATSSSGSIANSSQSLLFQKDVKA